MYLFQNALGHLEALRNALYKFKTYLLTRKPGKRANVRELNSCQGNVRDFSEVIVMSGEKILSGKSCLKLFIVSCIFVSIQVFSTSTGMI